MATPVDEARTAEHDSQPHYGLGLCLRAAVACLAVVVFGAGGIFAFHPTSLGSHESVVAAVGFAGGIGVVITSFVASSLVIAWADVVDRKMILPVGLMTYVLKIAAIGVVVFGLARKDWPGFYPLLWGIAIGAATWVITQGFWTFRWARKQPTVPFIPEETQAK